MSKKGFYFTLDILFAFVVFLIGISILYFYSPIYKSHIELKTNYAQSVMEILAKGKMRDFVNNPCFNISDENITRKIDLNNSVLEQLLVFWNSNYLNLTKNITYCLMKDILPQKYGFELRFIGSQNNTTVLKKGNTNASNIFIARRLVSGIDNYPTQIKGYIARVFLTNIVSKESCSYLYFPGFLGQGNFVKYFYLPNFSEIKSVYLELDTSNERFKVCINSLNNCSSFLQENDTELMKPGNWNLSNLSSYFKPGENEVYLLFENFTSYTLRYFAGGFLEVCYESNTFNEEDNLTYHFPGIYGMINLYDGFYIPGVLKNMSIHLHYDLPIPNSTLFLNIGGVEVFRSNQTGNNFSLSLNNTYLSTLLNFSNLSRNTIPLRLGTIANEIKEVNGYGNADVVLITDVSGSMSWRMDEDSTGVNRECCNGNSCSSKEELLYWMENPNNSLYLPSTSRISLAKCLDKYFVYKILNLTGNRISLVAFNSGIYSYTSLISDENTLITQINQYSAGGGTCICCAENKAYEILNSESNNTRRKFVIVMTDGIPSHKCGNYYEGNSCHGINSAGAFEYDCYGWGCCCDADPSTGYGCSCWTGANWYCSWRCKCGCEIENANFSSCRLHDNLNATVYSIGFGPVSNCAMGNFTLHLIANCGNGSYYGAQEGYLLKEIYENLTEQINTLSYINKTQILNISFIPNATLYEDSYINFEILRDEEIKPYGYIKVRFSSDQFGGNITSPKNYTLLIPNGTIISNAVVTSYTSAYWSYLLKVNNKTTFLLSNFGEEFTELGDPFIIHAPSSFFKNGENLIQVDTAVGTEENETRGGSPYDKLIYSLYVPSSIEYSKTFEKAEGSNITIYYDLDRDNLPDGNENISIGKNPNDIFDPEKDAIDYAFCKLLEILNFYGDVNEGNATCNLSNTQRDGGVGNPIDIRINSPGLRLNVLELYGLPILVGPAIAEIKIYS